MPSTNQDGFKPTRITYDLLKEWVPGENRRDIRPLEAWKIIAKFFCGSLASRGVCPQNAEQEVPCAACREEVIAIFQMEGAENAEALLTYRTRDAASRFGDRLLEAQRAAERDFLARETLSDKEHTRAAYLTMFQRNKDINLFLELAQQYDDENTDVQTSGTGGGEDRR